ncbi:hypothetical protein [Lysinibacillus sp. Y5S-8]
MALMVAVSGLGGLVSGKLFLKSVKQLAQAKKHIFAKSIRKSLQRRGVSNLVISGIISGLVVFTDFLVNIGSPGEILFDYLDRRDAKRKNGYFNGW